MFFREQYDCGLPISRNGVYAVEVMLWRVRACCEMARTGASGSELTAMRSNHKFKAQRLYAYSKHCVFGCYVCMK